MTWRALSVVAIIATGSAAVVADRVRPQASFATHTIAYDSAANAPFQVQTPAEFPLTYRLAFRLISSAGSRTPQNILQASGASGPTVRLSVQDGRLVMVLFGMDALPITVARTFAPDRWHDFSMSGTAQGDFETIFDGMVTRFHMSEIHQLQSSATIGTKDFTFRFNRIQVGAAEGGPAFRGRIAGLSFASRNLEPLAPAIVAVLDLFIASCVFFLVLPWLKRNSATFEVGPDDLAYLIVPAAAAIAIAAVSLKLAGGKWIILGCAGLATVLAARLLARIRERKSEGIWAWIAFGALFAASAYSLSSLPNGLAVLRMFEQWPFSSAFAVALTLCAAIAIVLSAYRARVSGAGSLWPYAACLPYVLFALLAVRTDSIFAPINALHWDYFVGPIRALREGGWLLWDTPSQYGFLNVLVPAALPIGSAINAFFWFQAAALFACAALMYRTLYRVLRIHWIGAAAVVVTFFFLADPLLIGPTPYPSESAVRFLWCYVLIAIAAANFFGEHPSPARFVRTATIPWVAGVFWSTESAFYASLMFFAPLCIRFCSMLPGNPREALREIAVLLRFPALAAAGAFLLMNAVYLIGLRHFPDWSMFAMYDLSYGAGFGERPIPWDGPVWLFALVLAAGAASAATALRRGREPRVYAASVAIALVWIVSSYYIGRAYPVVVTVLLPLIVTGLFVMIRAGAEPDRMRLNVALAVPVIALGLASAFWNGGIVDVARHLWFNPGNVWYRLPPAAAELTGVLKRANVDPSSPIVYYDTWVALPRIRPGAYQVNWLPEPIQDLESPISPALRDKVIYRFVARHRMSGYFIEALGGYNDPRMTAQWRQLLSPFYTVSMVAQNGQYRVFRFSLRGAQGQ